MGRLEEWRAKIKNPPPERLAGIEYRSHFLNMLGVSLVCSVLIYKGLWYIIFAFIFSLGVSYSQGMGAYAKYQMIQNMQRPESEQDIEIEKSPTRRRTKIINNVFGNKMNWIVSVLSVAVTVFGTRSFYSDIHFVLYTMIFLIILVVSFVLIYYFPSYWIANYIFQRKLKGGNLNGKKE